MSDPTAARDVTRRRLIQGAAAVTVAGAAGAALSGCAMGGGSKNEQAKGTADAKNPLGVKDDAALEVVIFAGGYEGNYADGHIATYKKNFPKADAKSQKITEIGKALQPRFAEGKPPEVVNNSGSGRMDPGGLVKGNQLQDLTDLFNAPSMDDPKKTVKDTLRPGVIDSGLFDSGSGAKPYIMNYTYSAYGVWYDAALFKKNKWEYPKTWDKMLELCAEIKKANIAPWAYPGVKAPYYFNWILLGMAVKKAGADILFAIDNLEPNAWKHDSIKEATEAIYKLAEGGYFLPGTEGLDHKQSQAEWSKGKVAFVSSGSWLENEQAKVSPPTFETTLAPVPSLPGDNKMPFETVRATASEPFIVSAKSVNARGGLEYLRGMLTKEGSKAFYEKVAGAITVVEGATDGLKETPGLKSTLDVLKKAGTNIYNWRYGDYYGTFDRNNTGPHMADLLQKKITPAQFIEKQQAAADKLAKDDSVQKFKRSKS